MCGIAGFVNLTPGSAPAGTLERMTGVIAHRGPDGAGFYRDSFAELGHRRLAIIDVAGGQQPISNETGHLWIIYNGEIFNHAEVRPDLERAGHVYRTRSDTETVVHAYEEYGPDCLSRFRGMFAFALWDRSTRTLLCARDRLGIKPFYYYWDGELFAFASEIKALLQHPRISPAFEESLLAEYLAFGYSSSDKTLFAGIRKLMPGCRLLLTPSGLSIERYWNLPQQHPVEERDDESWIREFRRRLEETVRLRLMSDVPLGVLLSGGVDSSAIAALMGRMVSKRVQSFSVGYREETFSELTQASKAAAHLGTDHREVIIGMDDFFAALPELVWHEDEPLAWPSSVALYFVSRLASQHVKVALTGEGSDELFAGYRRYRLYALNRRCQDYYRVLPAWIRGRIRQAVAASRLLSPSVRRKLQHTILGLDESLESLYLDNFYSAFSRAEQGRLLAPQEVNGGAYQPFLEHWRAAGASLLGQMLYADQKTYLVELLMKQDQMSMACSIESRVPFLDHLFVEFAAGVPDRMKMRGGQAKYILKRAVEDLLPRDIIYRTKMGFPTPLRQWLRRPEAAGVFAILRSKDGLVAQYLDRGTVERLIASHQSGLQDATDRIWRLLNLQLWGDIFMLQRRDRWREGLFSSVAALPLTERPSGDRIASPVRRT